jgi:hypothetical protein
MNKYFVLFCIPAQAIQDWMASIDETTRKEQTEKMMNDWNAWITDHESAILDKGLPIGKTKRVSSEGITDTKNDLNWYLVVQADSHDAAAELFKDHPHLQIPTAYIEVMDSNRPHGM